jgi:hypothetical protein
VLSCGRGNSSAVITRSAETRSELNLLSAIGLFRAFRVELNSMPRRDEVPTLYLEYYGALIMILSVQNTRYSNWEFSIDYS